MSLDDVNLRHVRAFCEVARLGSISAASSVVHLSQPAITQAIAKLERTLGEALFVRSNSGMETTEAGAIFARRAERALSFIQTGARQCSAASDTRSRRGPSFDHLVTAAQLRALIAVAEHRNFSLAARIVNVSQPSLHRLARDLERLSGTQLLRRASRGMEPTPAALVLVRHARLAFAELQQALEELDGLRGVDSARVMIGTLPLARSSILPEAITQLAALRPDVRIGVVDGPYDDLLGGLRNGGLDCIIGALRMPPPIDDIDQETLFEFRLSVVARADHPLATARRRPAVRDLARYPWVVPRQGVPAREHFDALMRSADVSPAGGLVESSSLVLIRGLLMASDRLTLLSSLQVRHEVERGVLRVLPIDLPQTSRPIGITTRRDWQPTAAQTQFLDLLRSTARRERAASSDYSQIE